MVDKKLSGKEAEELKKIYNHYVHKRSEIMKNTQFKVEDVFGDISSKDSFSPVQITKLNNYFSQNDVNINITVEFNFLKP